MTRLIWNAPEERFFDAGIDRGVLYPKKPEPLGAILRTNWIPNPSFEYGKSTWTNYSAGQTGAVSGLVEQEDDTYNGSQVCVVRAAAMGLTTIDRVGQRTDMIPIPELARATVKFTLGGTLPVNRNFRIMASYYRADNNFISDVLSPAINSIGAKEHLFGPTPALATQVRYAIFMTGSQPSGTTQVNVAAEFWIDAVSMEIGERLGEEFPYFDGDMDPTGYFRYTWAGTPGQSPSYQRERVSVAVPWNGLISVEEEGGEGAASYYIDGRPFLHLPRPKEYKANLSAYTYPDAFSEIMGVEEVADGMYLDSQMGLAFNLCYRTRVGNALEGADHGYKLHLVYNATVVPGALSYESLSDSINPTTFSWDIQAVPVQVEGFRPTAHIIIDTRHMDAGTIESIERIVYGDENNVAEMPSPQVIFDILSYGDTIIVTDNGDGTFDVTGSYENVYMLADGVFRVDNVDGQDNGDGTFTISSTNVEE